MHQLVQAVLARDSLIARTFQQDITHLTINRSIRIIRVSRSLEDLLAPM